MVCYSGKIFKVMKIMCAAFFYFVKVNPSLHVSNIMLVLDWCSVNTHSWKVLITWLA